MPKRDKKTRPWAELRKLRLRMEAQKNEEWYNSLTGRALYEMETQSLMNQTVIDRPVNLSMNNVTMTLTKGSGKKKEEKEKIKSVDPVTVMTDCMVDGAVVLRVRTSWTDLEIEDFQNVAELKIDGEGFIKFIRIQYLTLDANGKVGPWFRRDYEKKKANDPKSGKEKTISVRIDYPPVKKLADFDTLSPDQLTTVEIDFIPFVAQVWDTAQESFLIKKKRAFLELERVTMEISGENSKHSRRKLMVKAPAATELTLADLDDEINLLGDNGDAFYPDPHAAVINGFFKEQETQIEAIENATGVVATEKIVALSGVSRITAMKSLIDLSQKIRTKFIDLMILLEDLFKEHKIDTRQLTILVPPLGMLIVDVNNQATLLEVARAKGYISEYEERESIRQMLSL